VVKRIVIGVLVAAVIVLIVLAARPKPVEMQVATVSRGPLRITIDEDGKTRVRERYTVPAPVAGTLSRVELRAGDAVEPNTTIARLSPLQSPLLDPRAREVAQQQLASTRDAQQQAQAAVARGQASVDLAKSTLGRDQHLVDTGALGAAELEQAQADARMKESDLQSLRFAQQVAVHAITQAQAAASRFDLKAASASDSLEISSPVHGRIMHVLHEDAGPVLAGVAIVEVGDLDSMEIVAQLLSQDAVSVRPNMSAILTHWDASGREIRARVRRVEPAGFTKLSALGVEEQRVNVLLDLEDPASASPLGDGFAVEVSILTWSNDSVLQVPTSALFRDKDGWAVFALHEGRATVRAVQIGHRGSLRAEVTGGLVEGDVVVSHPGPTLKDGVRINGVRD
jgi:HlyD family secretion protein